MSLPDVILDALKGRSALVTGGTGMIGREVVRFLCDAGCEVTSVSLDEITVDSRARYVKGDLAEFNFFNALTKDTDLLQHLARNTGTVVVTPDLPAA
ncbi:MAG: NAD-dependent epimerase/dehydratase family protein, partial [Pseudomonadota bacterium]|nr:NAD-dependent epimerase/dehydratase family protein [Pseudomonadota bacterium]